MDDSVSHKLHKITQIFASLVDTKPNEGSGDKESTGTTVSISTKTQPQNHEAFYSRVDSFRPGLWNVLEVSPLECARWGWHLLEKDVLQCVTCQEVVCAILPDPADREAYCKFLNLLKHRLRESHKEACGWRHNPSPEELMQTPCADTIEELRNMANSASTLSALNSALPHIDNTTLMNTLKIDDGLIQGLFPCSGINEEVKTSSVLLVLSGWCRGQGAYLKCRVCRRTVGIWNFYTRANELKKTKEASSALATPDRGKRKLSSRESVGEESINNTKTNEDDDCSPNWSKRLRGKRNSERESEEAGNKQEKYNTRRKKQERTRKNDGSQLDEKQKDTNEESSPLIIGSSPSTQIRKMEEKQYFHPLEEHRHWCPWVKKIDDDSSNEESSQIDDKRGYHIVVAKVRTLVNLSLRKDLYSSEKYAKNVQGLRSIRNMLNELSSGDQLEDVGEK